MALNRDDIKALMQARFYQSHSNSGDGKFFRFVKSIDLFGYVINIHAEVDANQEQIELSVVELKYTMQLTTGRFQFDHSKFEDFEAVITHYAYHCLSNPPIFGV